MLSNIDWSKVINHLYEPSYYYSLYDYHGKHHVEHYIKQYLSREDFQAIMAALNIPTNRSKRRYKLKLKKAYKYLSRLA